MKTPRDHLAHRLVHLARALLVLALLALVPLRAHAHDCTISGPGNVDAWESFQLCGPSEDGAKYEWSGPGADRATTRCIQVTGRASGTYQYTLTFKTKKNGNGRGNGGWESRTCTHAVRVGGGSSTSCTITGPKTVDAYETFELCGPQFVHPTTYQWDGPGIESGKESRCVTIDDLGPGSYTFVLTTEVEGQRSRCEHKVMVVGEPSMCTVTGPTQVKAGDSFMLCGPSGSGLTYEWSGGENLPSNTTTRCVTISPLTREGVYTFYLRVTENGTSTKCAHMVRVTSGGASCSVTGPTEVKEGDSFTLCGPSGSGLTYEWSGGSNLPSNRTTRCVTVSSLTEGTYTYTLRVTMNGTATTCTHTVYVEEGDASCAVTGPAQVKAGDSFMLCGPSGSGLTYEWSGGENLPSNKSNRCVTISSLTREGVYTYYLKVTENGSSSTCTHMVRVTSGGTTCSVSGPTVVDEYESFQLCGPTGSGLTYEWTGGSNLPSNRTTRCVTISGLEEGTYTYTLMVTMNGTTTTCTHTVRVEEGKVSCTVSGPTEVKAGDSFQLCGPSGSGLTYEWSGGENLPSNKSSRCVTISGLTRQGIYTFYLKVTENGSSSTCTHMVRVTSGGASCAISGPTDVDEDESFTLCGPTGSGLTYEWSGGSHLPSNRTSRCVTISGLDQGTYTYMLRVWMNGTSTTCTHMVRVDGGGGATCTITGPKDVRAGERFTLCGPTGDDLYYSWEGPNLPDDTYSRCVTIDGLPKGTHRFTLEVDDEETIRSCTFDVHVDGTGGVADACPQPLSYWRQVCKKDKSWRDDLDRIAECIDDRSKSFRFDDDGEDLCDLLRDHDNGMKDRLRRQLVVTLVNVCARDLGLRGPDGSHIGLDGDMRVSCKWVDAKTLDDLIDRAEDMVGTRHATSSGGDSRTRMARAAYCLSKINRGHGFECEEDEDDEDRALAIAAAEEEADEMAGGTIELERPTPNPFVTSMRMRFAVEAGGARVTIGVYDIAGRLLQRLADGTRSAGVHEVTWDGRCTDGVKAMPGMYFVRGSVGTRPIAARVMFVK